MTSRFGRLTDECRARRDVDGQIFGVSFRQKAVKSSNSITDVDVVVVGQAET
ncbi:MAG: hypothetical protein ACI92S_005287 [Planctomycetaceae bacterium]|jgi:hypothetical protein